ncbi:MAG: ABC transporter substrate-binding protein, partial [Desulfuromonadales bacterium]|nr:ABC transporter substrate-binding protein [Desulfuromonadales bacterium]NIS39665.1 ABC transporter substrate-binding protein [Desulfuromonadales bacterium]
KDFTPYIQKIIASEADAVITGNWGQDMTLLAKSAADSGLDIPILTFYGGSLGTVAALGEGAIGT